MFENNLLGSFRDDKSLRNIFVRSKLYKEHKIPGSFTCNRSRCSTCEYISSITCIQRPFGTFQITRSFLVLVQVLSIAYFLQNVISFTLEKQVVD